MTKKPTQSQQRALRQFRQFMEERVAQPLSQDPFIKRELDVFAVQPMGSTKSLWVTAKTLIPSLPAGNLLRICDMEHWAVEVTPRGRLVAHLAPRSCGQFKGKRAFGVYFSQDLTTTGV